VALAGWSLADYYPGLRLADDYLSMAATLEALRHPRDAVILNNDADWPIFDYHYPFDYSRHIPSTQRVWDEKYARDLLNRFRNDYVGIWLVQTRYAEVTDPDNHLGEWLAARSWGQQRYTFPEGQVWFFAVRAERGDPATMRLAEQWPRIFQPVGDVPIAEGVRLAGFTQPVPEVRAGDRMIVGLGWQVDPGVQGEWPVAVKLIGPGGTEVASQMATLDGVGLPDGETRFLPVEVFIPPDAPDARVPIVFAAGERWVVLDTIRIRARPAPPPQQAAIPASARPMNVRFGDAITLVAVELPDRTGWRPGEGIPLTLYWRAEGVIAERYKVFVHLSGEAYDPADDSHIWGQQDQEPRNGASPTTAWRPGEVIADDYLVPLQPDAPPGVYRIQVGLYLPLGGQRLPAVGPAGEPLGDAVTMMEIEVGAPPPGAQPPG